MGKIADTTRTWSLGEGQRRQVLAFDSEFEDTKAQRDRLKSENDDLRSQVEPLKKDVERLQKRVEEETARADRAEKLAKFKAQKNTNTEAIEAKEELTTQEVEILQFVAYRKLKRAPGPSTGEVARVLKTNEIRAEVILRGLREREYIWYASQLNGGWKLGDKGQQYLVDHNIV